MTDTHERGPHGGGKDRDMVREIVRRHNYNPKFGPSFNGGEEGAISAALAVHHALSTHAASVVAMDREDDERLVEVMARAIWASSSGDPDRWDRLDVFTRGGLKDDARAALAAYRSAQVAL